MGASQGKAVLEHARLQVREKSIPSQLMAWGRSESFQCGAPVNGMLLRPKRITNLSDVPIAKVFAGNRHSAALLADGSIHTWGRNLNGQLGIGNRSASESSPTSLQQLEPYRKFTSVALGGSHSLFLDEQGSVWAAGSNEWGQLGLGTSLNLLSNTYQRPENLSQADSPENLMPMPVVMVKTGVDQRLQSVGLQSRPTGDWVAAHLAGSAPQVAKEHIVQAANTHHHVPNSEEANTLAAAAAGLSKVGPLLEWNNIAANEAHWPVRIGRDLTPLFEGFTDGRRTVKFAEMEFNKRLASVGMSLNVRSPREFIQLLSSMPLEAEPQAGRHSSRSGNVLLDIADAGLRGGGMMDPGHNRLQSHAEAHVYHANGHHVQDLALHEMTVTKVAAGAACSAALTASGEVWMFGFSHDRLFANGNAVQTEARPIDGGPARLIAENGGAIDVVLGSQYCAALARNGAVVLWGKVVADGVVVNWGASATPKQRSLEHVEDSMSGTSVVVTAMLPAMTHIAAGKKQLVLSNGEGVWHMRVNHESWGKTVETLQRMKFNDTFEGVESVASGGEASAVLDRAGKLWMWGLLGDATDSSSDLPAPKTAFGQAPAPCVSRRQKIPLVVPDLGCVTDVAVGKNHVLAVTSTS